MNERKGKTRMTTDAAMTNPGAVAALPVFVIGFLFENGQRSGWQTNDPAEFKKNYDAIHSSFGKAIKIDLGDRNRPELGIITVHMRTVVSVEAGLARNHGQDRLLAELQQKIAAAKGAGATPVPVKPEAGSMDGAGAAPAALGEPIPQASPQPFSPKPPGLSDGARTTANAPGRIG